MLPHYTDEISIYLTFLFRECSRKCQSLQFFREKNSEEREQESNPKRSVRVPLLTTLRHRGFAGENRFDLKRWVTWAATTLTQNRSKRVWSQCLTLITIFGAKLYNASVNSSWAQPPVPPPRAYPRALAIFFALDGKFPGVGTVELSNPPECGRKKRANAPSSVNTAIFFIDCTVE